jgi:hypothetical protein
MKGLLGIFWCTYCGVWQVGGLLALSRAFGDTYLKVR